MRYSLTARAYKDVGRAKARADEESCVHNNDGVHFYVKQLRRARRRVKHCLRNDEVWGG